MAGSQINFQCRMIESRQHATGLCAVPIAGLFVLQANDQARSAARSARSFSAATMRSTHCSGAVVRQYENTRMIFAPVISAISNALDNRG